MSKEKREKLDAIVEAFKTLPSDAQINNTVDRFNTYWPFFKTGLEFLESRSFTRKKRDKQIEALIAEGEKLHNDTALADKIEAFVAKVKAAWEKIRDLLEIVEGLGLSGPKLDDALNKLIAIGDEFTGYEEPA
jgi:predicted transcriptional regulator